MGASAVAHRLAEVPSLRVVQTLSAGYEDVLPHVPEGVLLANGAGVHDTSTAELAVGLASRPCAGSMTSPGRCPGGSGSRRHGPRSRIAGCCS